MKRIIMDVIANDDNITIGQAPFTAGKMDVLCERCHVHSSDSVLMAYDSTIFGSSKKGFILTDKGISTPDWFLSWIIFADCSFVKNSGSNIEFSGKSTVKLYVNSEIDTVIELFFKIKKAIRDKIAAEPLIAFNFKQVLMPLIFGDETVSKYVYYNSIVNSHKFRDRLNVHYGEEALLSFDTTPIGNSKIGFMMTERGIYQKNPFAEPNFLSWEEFISAASSRSEENPNYFVLALKDGGEYSIFFNKNQNAIGKFLEYIHVQLKDAYR